MKYQIGRFILLSGILLLSLVSAFSQEKIDIRENFKDRNLEWHEYAFASFYAEIDTGGACFTIKTTDEHPYNFGINIFADLGADFLFEVHFRNKNKMKGTYGIIFWNDGGGNTASFLLNKNKEYKIEALFDVSSSRIPTEYTGWKKSDIIQTSKDQNNHFKIEQKDGQLSYYINGVQLCSFPGNFKNLYFNRFGLSISGKNEVDITYFTLQGQEMQ